MALTPAERDEGWVLACMSTPLEDCVLDVSAMRLTEEEFLGGDHLNAMITELERNERIACNVRAVRLRLVEPTTVPFVAGQFVNVEIPGSPYVRTYSLANPPSKADHLDLIIKIHPGGRFSALVESGVARGTRLRAFGPLGKMRVRLSHRPMIMVADGVGLAPVLSMLADQAEKGNTRPIGLFFGVATAEHLFGLEQLRAIQCVMPSLEFVPVLAEAWPAAWSGETGLVTEALERHVARAVDHDAYVCGPSPCVQAAIPLLRRLGVHPRNIYVDVFTAAVR
jgi:NAD(P)H-flavin reductase